MDFIKSQFDRIQQQLAGLTPSQKMLSAALVAIMVMTLWWWGNYAGTPEFEPLLDQTLTTEDVGRIDMQLAAAGIEHKVVGGKIVVPAEKKVQALANLGYANMLPKNTASGFDEMIKQLTAWDGQDRQNAIFNHGKELSLQRVISHFPGVSSATVLIDPSTKFRLGREIESTATVNIVMRDGQDGTKQLATASAHLVAGSQAGLKPSRVKVVIGGRPFPVTDGENGSNGMLASTVLEAQQAAEKWFTDKVELHLRDIQGVLVSVTVKVNNSSESIDSTEVNKDKSWSAETETNSKSREDKTSSPATGEPGVVTNVGLAVGEATPAGPRQESTESVDTTKLTVFPAIKKTQTLTPAGNHTPVAASVRVPRSHFIKEAKSGDPAAKEPDAAAFAKAVASELPKIKAHVARCTGINDDNAIVVESYTDVIVPPRDAQMASASSFSMALGGHIKEIALGGLALASLFMMSMMVRKGAVAPIVAPVSVTRTAISNSLMSAESVAGEATQQDPTLDGMELDDDSIKTQQMLSQVTSMVGESPDTAAQLIKRWMNQR